MTLLVPLDNEFSKTLQRKKERTRGPWTDSCISPGDPHETWETTSARLGSVGNMIKHSVKYTGGTNSRALPPPDCIFYFLVQAPRCSVLWNNRRWLQSPDTHARWDGHMPVEAPTHPNVGIVDERIAAGTNYHTLTTPKKYLELLLY